jgi:hypothetical protein
MNARAGVPSAEGCAIVDDPRELSLGALASDDAAERVVDANGAFEVAHGIELAAEYGGEAAE